MALDACRANPYDPSRLRRTRNWRDELGRDQMVIGRRCERAVVTAYRELRATGNVDMDAFRACTVLYRIHHPEASINEARRLVSEWIDHHVIRGDTGPTPGCECGDD